MLNYLDLDPHRIIYLDDNLEFVRAAAEMNIESICVTSFKQMVEEMKRLGV